YREALVSDPIQQFIGQAIVNPSNLKVAALPESFLKP
ncbi:unnamed protein product, partial [marine sediment metagenome]